MSTATKIRVRGTLNPNTAAKTAETIVAAVKAKGPAPVTAKAKVVEGEVKNVYMFRADGNVWYTRTQPGRIGPSVYRPDRRGKPSYGWATLNAPIVPSDAVEVKEVPEVVAVRLDQIERLVAAADATMVHLIGSH